MISAPKRSLVLHLRIDGTAWPAHSAAATDFATRATELPEEFEKPHQANQGTTTTRSSTLQRTVLGGRAMT